MKDIALLVIIVGLLWIASLIIAPGGGSGGSSTYTAPRQPDVPTCSYGGRSCTNEGEQTSCQTPTTSSKYACTKEGGGLVWKLVQIVNLQQVAATAIPWQAEPQTQPQQFTQQAAPQPQTATQPAQQQSPAHEGQCKDPNTGAYMSSTVINGRPVTCVNDSWQ